MVRGYGPHGGHVYGFRGMTIARHRDIGNDHFAQWLYCAQAGKDNMLLLIITYY